MTLRSQLFRYEVSQSIIVGLILIRLSLLTRPDYHWLVMTKICNCIEESVSLSKLDTKILDIVYTFDTRVT